MNTYHFLDQVTFPLEIRPKGRRNTFPFLFRRFFPVNFQSSKRFLNKFYRNGNLLFKFHGDTYSHDGGRYKHSTVRIGVYRTSGIKGIDEIEADSDTLHFDDFIVASAEEMIDSIHSKFYKIDKSILGGLIIKVGSKMIDSSLLTKINKLKLSIKGV